MGEITGLNWNLEIKFYISPQGLVYPKGENMSLKKYVLKIYYDSKTDEIEHLSERFSDCDKYRLVIDDIEVDIPEDMQDYIDDIDLGDIGVS